MGKPFQISMFITSFIPLWISILVHDLLGPGGVPVGEAIALGVVLVVNVVCVLCLLASLGWARQQTEPVRTLKSAKREKSVTAEYLLAYILPLFAFDFTTVRGWVLAGLFFLVLGFLGIKNGNIYANLLLELRGYSFYDCLTETADGAQAQVLILSRQNLAGRPDGDISIVSLGEPVYMDITARVRPR